MTSIAQRVGAYSSSVDSIARAAEFLQIARALIGSKNSVEARSFLQHVPCGDRTITAFNERAAVLAGTVSDSTWAAPLSQYQLASDAFAESLRNASAFDRVLTDGSFLRVPPLSTIAITTAGASAQIVGEGAPKPATQMTFTSANVTMSKCSVFVVISAELMRAAGAGPIAMLGRELRGGLAQVTDQYFIGQLTTGLTAIPSSGVNALAIRADLKNLMDAITIGSGARLYYLAPPQIAKRLSVVGDSAAGRMFPGSMPTGGVLDGIPLLVSDEAAAGTLTLFDATQIAVSAGEILLDRSDAASLVIDTAPDSPPIAASAYTNLWQQNLSALRAERFSGASRLRTTAAAQISNVSGAGNSPS